MRKIIIDRLREIEIEEKHFTGTEWNDFYIGGYHISLHPSFEGMPDEILLTFFEEVIKILAVCR